MTSGEDTRSIVSLGQLSKSSSTSPSAAPLLRQQNKKIKGSKSSASVMKNSSLIPQKDVSVYSNQADESVKKVEVSKECDCGTDLYSRVLGPTADETILTGLQTVIDLCSKLRVCGDKDDSGDEAPEKDQDVPERDLSDRVKSSKSETKRSMVSAGFQVNPTVRSLEVQTTPFPQVVSQILQNVGLTPEMVSELIQTSFTDIVEPEKTNVQSATTQSDQIKMLSKQTMSVLPLQLVTGDEHSGISPSEPPVHTKICRCCKCASSDLMSKESKASEDKAPCYCGSKKLSKCKCGPGPKRSNVLTNGDQQAPSEVRYAVTKISKYKEFTTFEVMKSTKNQPRTMPKSIEGVFVLKKKNGNSKSEVEGTYRESKSDTNGSKNKKSHHSKGEVKGKSTGEIASES